MEHQSCVQDPLCPPEYQRHGDTASWYPHQHHHGPNTRTHVLLTRMVQYWKWQICLTLSRPREMANFSKSLTMNWETTCDIPFKRYFLECAINHTNRDGGGHIWEWEKSKTKEEKHWKFSYSLYILGIPLNYSLMYSCQCIACCRISTGPLTYKRKKIQKFEGW